MNLDVSRNEKSMKQFKIIIEKHPDGYVATLLVLRVRLLGREIRMKKPYQM